MTPEIFLKTIIIRNYNIPPVYSDYLSNQTLLQFGLGSPYTQKTFIETFRNTDLKLLVIYDNNFKKIS